MNSANISYDDLINETVDVYVEKGMVWVLGHIVASIQGQEEAEYVDAEEARKTMLAYEDKPRLLETIIEMMKMLNEMSAMQDEVVSFFKDQGIDHVYIDGVDLMSEREGVED